MMYVKFPIPTKHIFFNPAGTADEIFKFSSDLEKIGSAWDVAIRNGTNVEIISDPVEISRPRYGVITVVKVKADVATDYHTIIKELWIPTACIVELENNETRSTQFAN
jgi:hypothetical protein